MVHPDRPQVVFDHKNHGELPEGSHVEALVELTDVARAVAEESDWRGGEWRGLDLFDCISGM